jgi:hypothetical protein
LLVGLSIWTVGNSHAVYIGFSGVLFGWFSNRLVAGWLMKTTASEDTQTGLRVLGLWGGRSWRARIRALLFALITVMSLGSSFWMSLFPRPGMGNVAWEAHLFGFIYGFLLAVLYHKCWVPCWQRRKLLSVPTEVVTANSPLFDGQLAVGGEQQMKAAESFKTSGQARFSMLDEGKEAFAFHDDDILSTEHDSFVLDFTANDEPRENLMSAL